MPEAVRRAIVLAYGRLSGEAACGVPVAVRSSATAEDTASTSFAGMNETFTNVAGADAVVERVVECWASLWGPRVSPIAPPAASTPSRRSRSWCSPWSTPTRPGLFTADPATGACDHLVIEAAFGLGEVMVGGQVEPDSYVVAKDGRVLHQHLGTKAARMVRGGGGHDQRVAVPAEDQARPALDDRALATLARLAGEVEQHYGSPQDVEFASDAEGIWIVQSRPITTLGQTAANGGDEQAGTVLASGLAAAPGVAAGPVRILRSPSEGARLVAGEVLVAPMTNPDWVPTMRRAVALAGSASASAPRWPTCLGSTAAWLAAGTLRR